MIKLNKKKVADLLGTLCPRDAGFVSRIYSGDLQRYRHRVEMAGITGFTKVLDCGCGFGQWTNILSLLNNKVVALDISEIRIKVGRAILEDHNNVDWVVGSLTKLPLEDESIDAIFCYSVIYYSDPRSVVKEFARVLKPGGRFYIVSNGIGWYIYNIIKNPNFSEDFNGRLYGLKSIFNTCYYSIFKEVRSEKDASVVTSLNWLKHELKNVGLLVEKMGGEGKFSAKNIGREELPFFPSKYWGLECCSEWIGSKQ